MSSLAEMHDLTQHVSEIETRLHELDESLRLHDAPGMEAASLALHQVLAEAMAAFRHAQQMGHAPLSNDLKQRLMLAQTRVSGVQAAVHRASATLQRTLGVLLAQPDEPQAAAYAALGAKKSVAASLKAYGS
jgi:hypothetical protein